MMESKHPRIDICKLIPKTGHKYRQEIMKFNRRVICWKGLQIKVRIISIITHLD